MFSHNSFSLKGVFNRIYREVVGGAQEGKDLVCNFFLDVSPAHAKAIAQLCDKE